MRIGDKIVLGSLVALACVLGCREEADPLERVVFIKDGSLEVTAAEVRDAVLLSAKINKLSGRPVKEKDFIKWANSTAFRTIPGCLGNHLLREEFDQKNIRATEASDQKILTVHNKFMRQKARSKEELSENFVNLRDFYLRQFDIESRKSAYLDAFAGTIEISDGEVGERMAELQSRHENEVRIFNEATKRGRQAWEALNAGDRWDEVAQKFSEDKLVSKDCANYYREWEFVPKSGPYFPQVVADKVRQLKVGEYTAPLDTEEGLLIVKILGVQDDLISCARIMIRLPVFTEVPEKKQLKENMKKEAVKEHLDDLLDRLKAKHNFSYPMGTNILYEIFK